MVADALDASVGTDRHPPWYYHRAVQSDVVRSYPTCHYLPPEGERDQLCSLLFSSQPSRLQQVLDEAEPTLLRTDCRPHSLLIILMAVLSRDIEVLITVKGAALR